LADTRITSGVRPASCLSRSASARFCSARIGAGGCGGCGFGGGGGSAACAAWFWIAAARISAANTTMNSTSNSDVRSGGR
jgi:hypothetical protein